MRQERKGEKKGKRGGSTGGCLIFIVTGWLTKLKRGESFQCAFSKLWSWWWSWRWHISHKFFFLSDWLIRECVCMSVCVCVCVCYVQRKSFSCKFVLSKILKEKSLFSFLIHHHHHHSTLTKQLICVNIFFLKSDSQQESKK